VQTSSFFLTMFLFFLCFSFGFGFGFSFSLALGFGLGCCFLGGLFSRLVNDLRANCIGF
jgi:hypothetical protein